MDFQVDSYKICFVMNIKLKYFWGFRFPESYLLKNITGDFFEGFFFGLEIFFLFLTFKLNLLR